MSPPPSDLFTTIPLDNAFNCDRATLDDALTPREFDAYGAWSWRGVPFQLGAESQANAILLDGNAINIEAGNLQGALSRLRPYRRRSTASPA